MRWGAWSVSLSRPIRAAIIAACGWMLRRRSRAAEASRTITEATDHLGRGLQDSDGFSGIQPFKHLLEGRSLGDLADLGQEVIGQGHPEAGRSGFQGSVYVLRHVADLDHPGHAQHIITCAQHDFSRVRTIDGGTPRSEWTRGSSCCAEDGVTLEKLLEPLVESDGFQALLARPGDRLGRAEAPGHPYAAAALAVAVDAPVLAVLPGPREARACADGAAAFLGPERVALFPSWEALPVEGISPSPETVARRARAARLLRPAEGPTVVTAQVAAVVQRLGPPIGGRGPLRLAVGDEIAPDRLAERLVGLGYVRSDLVVHRGELAVRGGIVDVFPGVAARPARIEFVGDEIERIRTFSPATQITERPIDALEIDPVRELLPDELVREAGALAEATGWVGPDAVAEPTTARGGRPRLDLTEFAEGQDLGLTGWGGLRGERLAQRAAALAGEGYRLAVTAAGPRAPG